MKRIACVVVCCAFAARATEPPPPPPPPEDTPARANAPEQAPREANPPEEAAPTGNAPVQVPARDANQHMPWKRRVHLLTGDGRVELRRASNLFVCRAPCDAEVEFLPDEEFYLGGPGLASSGPFSLKLREEDATLVVRPYSSSRKVGGAALLLAGGVAAVVGGAGAFLGYAVCASDNDHGGSCSANGLLVGSVLLGVAGAALLIAGGNVISGRTEFDVE